MYSSHIKWLRIETDTVPLYPVNTYVPHAVREQAPFAEGTLEELKRIVRGFPASAMVLLMGDFNGRMKRSHDFTGKKGQKVSDKTMGPWSVHNEENEQGKLVREMAEDLDLVAVFSLQLFPAVQEVRRSRHLAGLWRPEGLPHRNFGLRVP